MGMDVYGNNPKSEAGSYFRASVWGWHPLWELCEAIAPELTAKVEYGHTNDGDGLGHHDSEALAATLQRAIDEGVVAAYVKIRDDGLAALPDEDCSFCGATGTRTDAVGVELGYAARNYCNACDGKGKRRPFATSYHVDVGFVKEWVAFLQDCGGFAIN